MTSPKSYRNSPKSQTLSHIIESLRQKRLPFYWLGCIPLVALILVIGNTAVSAQSATPPSPEDLQGALNAVWVLVASILVIFMNAGFAMLETGFCRQKNAVNVLSKNLIVFALATIAYWAIGFSLMFGTGITGGFMGIGGFFLSSSDPATYGLSPFPTGLPIPLFFLFQAAFAGTAATIVSGAVAERIKFIDFLVFSLIIVGIIYPITGHWIWSANGWLFKMGFKDFAGSTAVHSVGGWSALIGAYILGPRIGKYKADRANAIPGHNMSIATLGCLILWVCWFGFNAGSNLVADPNAISYIAVTTNLGGAIGAITATATAWVKDGKPDLSMIINGILAGLVAVTAGCNEISYFGSIVIGGVAGILVVYAVSFFDKIRIDDPVGATSVHLVCGVWGTFAVGLFNTKAGLLTSGNAQLLGTQTLGILTVGGFTVLINFIVWYLLKQTLGIRVEEHEELDGLDVGEHGMEAYTGFVKEPDIFATARSFESTREMSNTKE